MLKRHIKTANKLAQIRNGLGAAKIPRNITKLTLLMAFKNKNGQMGCRKFWRQHLPSIQFHNPHLQIEVRRSHEETRAIMQIDQTSGDPIFLDMQYKQASDICQELFQKIHAVPVKPSDTV